VIMEGIATGYLRSKKIHPRVLAGVDHHFSESTVSFKFPVAGFDGVKKRFDGIKKCFEETTKCFDEVKKCFYGVKKSFVGIKK